MGYSGAGGKLIDEKKNRSKNSHDTVPLRSISLKLPPLNNSCTKGGFRIGASRKVGAVLYRITHLHVVAANKSKARELALTGFLPSLAVEGGRGRSA